VIIAEYLAVIMDYLNFYILQLVTTEEIEYAAKSLGSAKSKSFLKMIFQLRLKIDLLIVCSMVGLYRMFIDDSIRAVPSFDNKLTAYVQYMCKEKRLSDYTINRRCRMLTYLC